MKNSLSARLLCRSCHLAKEAALKAWFSLLQLRYCGSLLGHKSWTNPRKEKEDRVAFVIDAGHRSPRRKRWRKDYNLNF